MTNIDLYQSIKQNEQLTVKEKFIDTGTIAAILVIVLAFLAWGGVKLFKSYLTGKVTLVEAQVQKTLDDIGSMEIAQIVDVQSRLLLMESNLSYLDSREPGNILKKIEDEVLPGAYLTALKYEDKDGAITLSGDVTNFTELARQTMAFKQSVNFKKFQITGNSAGSGGKTMKFSFGFELK